MPDGLVVRARVLPGRVRRALPERARLGPRRPEGLRGLRVRVLPVRLGRRGPVRREPLEQE
ncbi:hypothetical protein, partial [Streptomyces mobaraensis]|uniref:hypothetical protein n=1 Tax=Streptomyces mobaraensis TaxID=35621 RepID=UPI00059509AA